MENDWLKDFFIQFLKSPKWVNPIQEFIDNQCFIFDSEEENKLVYTDCHVQFKVLIDALLTEQLKDVVTEENLKELCAHMDNPEKSGPHDAELCRLIAEHLLCVEDFLQFRQMMMKRNLEQQMEALRSFQTEQKEEGKIQENGDDDEEYDMWKNYEEELERALLLSQENDTDCFEESELQRAIALSLQEIKVPCSDHNENNTRVNAQRELAPVTMRKPLPEGMKQLPSQVPSFPKPSTPPSEPVPAPQAQPPPPGRRGPTEEEKQLRAEHLKRQREMLLAKRAAERQKEMEAYDKLRAKAAQKPVTPAPEPSVKQSDLAPEVKSEIMSDPEKTATQLRQALTLQLRQSLLPAK